MRWKHFVTVVYFSGIETRTLQRSLWCRWTDIALKAWSAIASFHSQDGRVTKSNEVYFQQIKFLGGSAFNPHSNNGFSQSRLIYYDGLLWAVVINTHTHVYTEKVSFERRITSTWLQQTKHGVINEQRNKHEKEEEHEIDVSEPVWGTSENNF